MKKSLSLAKRVRSSSGSIFRGGEDEDDDVDEDEDEDVDLDVDVDEDDSYRNCVDHDEDGDDNGKDEDGEVHRTQMSRKHPTSIRYRCCCL